MTTPQGPAYRIETERLVVRCYRPGDAPLLQVAIEESVEHLRPWMPWIDEEPKTLAQRVTLLRRFRGQFDLDQDYIYGIFNRDETRLWGGTGLHTRRGEGVREIGYWIHADQVRRGLVTESTAALIRVAFEVEQVVRVEIRCDPENVASAAIPRKLAFTHEGVLRHETEFLGKRRDTSVWGLLVADYPGSPAAAAPLKAFDVLGQPLLS
ncbi:MAG: GNAT family protein [Candidatus Promineifilaceae bacterium]|nr:GNAT family protein [Candidatus Promineifilaceae bacterium]